MVTVFGFTVCFNRKLKTENQTKNDTTGIAINSSGQ